ncbi:DsrE family protein [Pseudohalocynthiibacter aestuariivivens]|uniref:DsrE family protein n=1 Tax=Pseudohalocynthiibacter aestuariivivens TaxID=1591409 RepID=A0ABV5JFI4_9RHOB|nr:DsrE family protein [Pseudohalocynthiibacter aestuariivivens]MBS9717761.1 DsrE family protein [Pseudohalocynthiibacter aestuariivivens]
MSKTAIVVYSDPKAGSEEAVGRLFNAMFLAYELKDKKQEVELIFQGAGVRWASELVNPEHPAHALYNAVSDTVAGACKGCAEVFGATDDVKSAGFELVGDKAIPGTAGVIDLSRYLDEGYRIVTF